MLRNVYVYAIHLRLQLQCVSEDGEHIHDDMCAVFERGCSYIDGRDGCGKSDERAAVLQRDKCDSHHDNGKRNDRGVISYGVSGYCEYRIRERDGEPSWADTGY